MTLREGGEGERVWGTLVSTNFFGVLDVTMPTGRRFLPEEGAAGLAAYLGSTRVFGSLLFQLSPTDVRTLAIGVGLLALVTPAAFYALCAQAMRYILVDAARARGSLKRGGGGGERVPFDERLAVSPEPYIDVLALDEALKQLSLDDPRQGRVVELRYFGGLSVEETAEVLGVSPQTVMRDWKLAKLWLAKALRDTGGADKAKKKEPS